MSLLNVRKNNGEKPAKQVGAPAHAPKGTSMRPSSDRLAHLESKVSALAGRVDGHDSRFGDQEQWNAQAQQRVNRLETITGGSGQRRCPGCGEMRDDGPTGFPGYAERVATVDEPDYHAWRQLCHACREGRQAPEHG